MILHLIDGSVDTYSYAETRVEDGILTVYRRENRLVDEVLARYPVGSVLKWTP